jgi:hypothetical protein
VLIGDVMIDFRQYVLLASSLMMGGIPTAEAVIVQDREVIIREGERPANGWRTHAGTCGNLEYEVSIRLGKRLSEAIRDARIHGVSRGDALRSALRKWAAIEGSVVDAVVDRCEPTRARIRMETVRRNNPSKLYFYYLWLDRNGGIELVGER